MCTLRQFAIGVGVAALLAASSSPARAQACGTGLTTPLLAGQTMPAGTVKVFNDARNIYVQYTTTMPWTLGDVHVAAAPSLSEIPQKNGNPIPGRFAYNATFDSDLTDYTVAIPRASTYTDGREIVIAAHAIVQAPKGQGGTQTGWGWGPDFPGANWATYITYQVQGCGVVYE